VSVALAKSQPPAVLRMLAHSLRWQMVCVLARGDRRVRELVDLLGQPYNLVSYHLHQLRKNDVVKEHRSSHDGRDVYYSLDLDYLQQAYFSTADSVHPAVGLRSEEREEAAQSAEA
jgi:DNA-binding transcriptional ArsR family regulator